MLLTWFLLVAMMLDGVRGVRWIRPGRRACCTCSWRARKRSGALLIRTIGPVWDGNEVWLLAGGGTLYFAFPLLYASGFSGFYLPLMIVLWLLILRGIGDRAAHAPGFAGVARAVQRRVRNWRACC